MLSAEAQELYGALARQEPAPDSARPALAELLDFGLVLPHPHNPADRFVTRDPLEVLAEKRDRIYRQIGAAMAEVTALPEHLRPLAAVYQGAAANLVRGAVEYVSGIETINARLSEIIAGAAEELLTAQPGGPRPADMLALSLPRDRAALQRGVTMRTLYRTSVRSDGPTAQWAAQITSEGGEIRTLDEEFMRAIIVDRRIAVVTDLTEHTPGTEPVRALILHDPGVVHYAAAMFERDWARASAWRGHETPAEAELTELQTSVLRLLVSGRGQASIATTLEVSSRTVHAQIAEIKRVSGANSLAQLGYWWAKRESE
ncbi:LuxR C-terminal-related transcriptional regulator [Kitasatospora sp. HPMI-4]|uniref:LuxR C-terminal-related transcriptional regulator n=1 Tax=Kitasatospora sp. HPMI-4 TaxID=3448443 RepID=UPI003F1D256B